MSLTISFSVAKMWLAHARPVINVQHYSANSAFYLSPHAREVLHYNDVTIPLTLSDVDSLENKPHPQSVPGKASKTHTHSQVFLSQAYGGFDQGQSLSLVREQFLRRLTLDESTSSYTPDFLTNIDHFSASDLGISPETA